jgi:putative DNA primase/helicase
VDSSALLRSIGCLDPIPADGRIHRWKPEGRGKKNGWAVLHREGDGIWGAAGNWATGDRVTIRDGNIAPQAFTRLQAQLDKRRRSDAVSAMLKALTQWSQAGIAKWEYSNPYLTRKQISAFGVRFLGDTVIIPMYDVDGGLHGTQTIYPDGSKYFTKGCAKKGKMHTIPGKTFTVIAEGYATAASIHMATGFECIVAFDAGNLRPVAEAIRQRHPKAQLIIAADDDRNTEGNPGLTKANEAAKAVKAKVAVPLCLGSDFNDVHTEKGLTEVALQIYSAL